MIRSALACMACAAGTAMAQPDEAQMAWARTAISIDLFDELAAACVIGGGFSSPQQKRVDAWQAANGVSQLRARLDGGALTPQLRDQARDASRQIVRQVAAGKDPCVAAVSATRLPESQFATRVPQLLASKTPSPAAAPAPREATPEAKQERRDASDLAARIEGFGFDTCTRMGIGGMVMVSACPVVLFKNGEALTDVEDLNLAKPKSLTRWRRASGKIQLEKQAGWENLGYTAVYSMLPKDFSLDGQFRSTRGAGTAAIGGGQSVTAWTNYTFFPDGRVQRGGGAAASSNDSGTAVTTTSRAAAMSGRYRLDGLTLVMRYDDGSTERRIIIADPKDGGKGTMWLDGEGYVWKKR